MSDETNVNKGATAETVLDAPVEEHPVAAALADELGGDTVESILDDIDDDGEDDYSIQDIFNNSKLAEPAEESTTAKTADEAEEEIILTKSQYDAMLSEIAGKAEQQLGETAVPVPDQVAAEPPKLEIPTPEVPEPTWEELAEVITDPKAFANYLAEYGKKIQEATVAGIMPRIMEQVSVAATAQQFEREFFEKHPSMKEHPEHVVKALAKAQRQFAAEGKNASYSELFAKTEENLSYALNVRRNIEKSGERRDVRGRFAPKVGPRTQRPNAAKPQTDPFVDSITNFYALDESPAGDLLAKLGAY